MTSRLRSQVFFVDLNIYFAFVKCCYWQRLMMMFLFFFFLFFLCVCCCCCFVVVVVLGVPFRRCCCFVLVFVVVVVVVVVCLFSCCIFVFSSSTSFFFSLFFVPASSLPPSPCSLYLPHLPLLLLLLPRYWPTPRWHTAHVQIKFSSAGESTASQGSLFSAWSRSEQLNLSKKRTTDSRRHPVIKPSIVGGLSMTGVGARNLRMDLCS